MADQPQLMELRFPVGGLVRRGGYQDQSPQTSPDCKNVRALDTLEGRERGGSRPGMIRAYSDPFAGAPQALAVVSKVSSEGVREDKLIGVAGGMFFAPVGSVLAPRFGDSLQTELGQTIQTEGGSDLGGGAASASRFISSIATASMYDKVYFADFGPPVVSGFANVQGGTQVVFTKTINQAEVDVFRDICLISPVGTSGVEAGGYIMSDITATLARLNKQLTTGLCSYSILPGIKVYSATSGAVYLLESSKGTPPYGSSLVARYRNRLVLAGPGQNWYMSRQGDATDWDYGANPADAARAVSGPLSDAGALGEPITALIPYSDDYLIFGCENSLWILRGDPTYGGQIGNLSTEVGIINGTAWCRLPDASVLFLGRSGLYLVAAGGGQYPVEFSRNVLPRELLDVPASTSITMMYDIQEHGVHLFLTPVVGTGTHWWIDWRTKTFWPVTFSLDGLQPRAGVKFASAIGNPRYNLFVCNDGYIRRFSNSAGDDDGRPIESEVTIGPFRMAGELETEGILSELSGTMDESSGQVNWNLGVAPNSEAAIAALASPQASGAWSSGRSKVSCPRVRGGALAVRVGSNGTARWALESINGVVHKLGRERP